MRGVILDLRFVLLSLAFLLVSIAASDAAEKGLSGARSRIDVGLEGGGVLVRHDVEILCSVFEKCFVEVCFFGFAACELNVVEVSYREKRSKGFLC